MVLNTVVRLRSIQTVFAAVMASIRQPEAPINNGEKATTVGVHRKNLSGSGRRKKQTVAVRRILDSKKYANRKYKTVKQCAVPILIQRHLMEEGTLLMLVPRQTFDQTIIRDLQRVRLSPMVEPAATSESTTTNAYLSI